MRLLIATALAFIPIQSARAITAPLTHDPILPLLVKPYVFSDIGRVLGPQLELTPIGGFAIYEDVGLQPDSRGILRPLLHVSEISIEFAPASSTKLLGAQEATLTVTSAEFYLHSGLYEVRVDPFQPAHIELTPFIGEYLLEGTLSLDGVIQAWDAYPVPCLGDACFEASRPLKLVGSHTRPFGFGVPVTAPHARLDFADSTFIQIIPRFSGAEFGSVIPVPEPSTAVLAALGLLAFAWWRRHPPPSPARRSASLPS